MSSSAFWLFSWWCSCFYGRTVLSESWCFEWVWIYVTLKREQSRANDYTEERAISKYTTGKLARESSWNQINPLILTWILLHLHHNWFQDPCSVCVCVLWWYAKATCCVLASYDSPLLPHQAAALASHTLSHHGSQLPQSECVCVLWGKTSEKRGNKKNLHGEKIQTLIKNVFFSSLQVTSFILVSPF